MSSQSREKWAANSKQLIPSHQSSRSAGLRHLRWPGTGLDLKVLLGLPMQLELNLQWDLLWAPPKEGVQVHGGIEAMQSAGQELYLILSLNINVFSEAKLKHRVLWYWGVSSYLILRQTGTELCEISADKISALSPDHSGCDISVLQLQGLGDHSLHFSTARTGFRSPAALWMLVLLSCWEDCSRQRNHQWSQRKRMPPSVNSCVWSPQRKSCSQVQVLLISSMRRKTQQLVLWDWLQRENSHLKASVSWKREILIQTTSSFWWRWLNLILFLLNSANTGI